MCQHVDMLDTLQVYVVVQVHCCHGRRVDKGARLSELLVTMLNIALDGGKWSWITLGNECLIIQVESKADLPLPHNLGLPGLICWL